MAALGVVGSLGGALACGHEHPPVAPAPTTAAAAGAGLGIPYPPAPRDQQVDVIHGVSVADPYRWLENASRADVKAWVRDEDAMARAFLKDLPGRDALAARFKELFYVESVGVPRLLGGRLFYPRRDAGKEKAAVYWREWKSGRESERVLLDPNTWSADGSVSLGVWSVSHDGKKVAYAVKGNNSDEATLHVLDVATGKPSAVDVIEGAKYAWPSWEPSGRGFYYTWLPPVGQVPAADRPGYADVRFHELGTDPKRDTVVYEKTGDPKTFVGASVDRAGRWLIVTVEHGWTRTDLYFQDLRSNDHTFKPLITGQDARYDVSVDGDRFFVLTNEGAPRYRVLRVDPAAPDRSKWTEIVAERAGATLEGVSVVGHRLSLAYLKDVVSHVELRDEDGQLVREVALPTLGSASVFSGESDDDVAYYSFQSFTYPTEIFETNVKTGETRSFYRLKVPVDESAYVVDQLFATSKDGTRVPFFVVHAKSLRKSGDTPTILTGYGGFQVAETPAFSSAIFPWLEHGGIW
ncbi:MAG: prolyl oligopeptidase family serine peptidase, partial [Polyangiaceae bacterium]